MLSEVETSFKYICILSAVIAMITACGEKPAQTITPKIVGSWELTDIQYTKAAQIGGETVEVRLVFDADGSFSMSQMLGEGRFVDYSGSWVLDGEILSGTYSDGKAWGASYSISVDDRTLSMIPVGKDAPETYVYTRL